MKKEKNIEPSKQVKHYFNFEEGKCNINVNNKFTQDNFNILHLFNIDFTQLKEECRPSSSCQKTHRRSSINRRWIQLIQIQNGRPFRSFAFFISTIAFQRSFTPYTLYMFFILPKIITMTITNFSN